MKAKLWTDGGARGNPGPAAYAYVLEDEEGGSLAAHGEAIGVATNNVAEYSALIAGLEKAVELGVDELDVISDSELMVKQMRGEYRVKNRDLQSLFLDASRAARESGGAQGELAQRLVLDLVLAAHLLDEELGVGHDLDLGDGELECLREPGDETAVLGDVVRRDADRLAVRCEDGAVVALEDVCERGRPGVAARAAVGVETRLHRSW